ncbi:hypothetical protein LTR09_000548 [Extremus antarcticus]|uniref:Secreted protein n=1 Tax=Extremus antarcticus TaxID=702011 RepID=A0AAJ0GJV2_9PEZI|nr:hypothetical protein LTR09_000548 [Extremus antarcticus]
MHISLLGLAFGVAAFAAPLTGPVTPLTGIANDLSKDMLEANAGGHPARSILESRTNPIPIGWDSRNPLPSINDTDFGNGITTDVPLQGDDGGMFDNVVELAQNLTSIVSHLSEVHPDAASTLSNLLHSVKITISELKFQINATTEKLEPNVDKITILSTSLLSYASQIDVLVQSESLQLLQFQPPLDLESARLCDWLMSNVNGIDVQINRLMAEPRLAQKIQQDHDDILSLSSQFRILLNSPNTKANVTVVHNMNKLLKSMNDMVKKENGIALQVDEAETFDRVSGQLKGITDQIWALMDELMKGVDPTAYETIGEILTKICWLKDHLEKTLGSMISGGFKSFW